LQFGNGRKVRDLIAHVVYVVESPLSHRDFDRFGIARLQARGLTVEVWDVHEIFLPRPGLPEVPLAGGVPIQVMHSLEEIVTAASQLTDTTAVVLLSGAFLGNMSTHLPLMRALMRSPATLGTVSAGQRPPMPGDDLRLGLLQRQVLRVRHQAGALRRGETSPTRMVKRARQLIQARRFVRAQDLGFRPLDYAWVGTDTAGIQPVLLGPNTQVRFIHTHDYDLILQSDLTSSQDFGPIFLDTMGPLHPDFAVLEDLRAQMSVEQWFGIVTRALTQVELHLGKRVTIAAHPRASKGQLEPLYEQREVLYGQTLELIAGSSLVLTASPTTSLGLVASLERPLTILRPSSLYARHLMELDEYARLLDAQVVSAEDVPNSWEPPPVPLSAYAMFVEHHMKRPGTPIEPFWDVVASDLLQE